MAYTDKQIQDYWAGIKDKPDAYMNLYNASKQHGVSNQQLSSALGFSETDINTWIAKSDTGNMGPFPVTDGTGGPPIDVSGINTGITGPGVTNTGPTGTQVVPTGTQVVPTGTQVVPTGTSVIDNSTTVPTDTTTVAGPSDPYANMSNKIGYDPKDLMAFIDESLNEATTSIQGITDSAFDNLDDYAYDAEQTESFEDVFLRFTADPNSDMMKRSKYLGGAELAGMGLSRSTAAGSIALAAMLDAGSKLASGEILSQQFNVGEANKVLSDAYGAKVDLNKMSAEGLILAHSTAMENKNTGMADAFKNLFDIKKQAEQNEADAKRQAGINATSAANAKLQAQTSANNAKLQAETTRYGDDLRYQSSQDTINAQADRDLAEMDYKFIQDRNDQINAIQNSGSLTPEAKKAAVDNINITYVDSINRVSKRMAGVPAYTGTIDTGTTDSDTTDASGNIELDFGTNDGLSDLSGISGGALTATNFTEDDPSKEAWYQKVVPIYVDPTLKDGTVATVESSLTALDGIVSKINDFDASLTTHIKPQVDSIKEAMSNIGGKMSDFNINSFFSEHNHTAAGLESLMATDIKKFVLTVNRINNVLQIWNNPPTQDSYGSSSGGGTDGGSTGGSTDGDGAGGPGGGDGSSGW